MIPPYITTSVTTKGGKGIARNVYMYTPRSIIMRVAGWLAGWPLVKESLIDRAREVFIFIVSHAI